MSERDVLAEICDAKRVDVATRKQRTPLAVLERQEGATQPARGFANRLRQTGAGGRPALIAEIKKASPSKGLIRADFDPATLARAYKEGGATCLSVLTDTPYFQGRDEHLQQARQAVDLPVLRKDFTVDPDQVVEARVIGADCILLIVAALDDSNLRSLTRLAHDLGLDVLVEIHDEVELDRGLAVEGALLGINNRNLKTLTVDLAVFERLAPRVPHDRLLVAESGLKTATDLVRLRKAGAGAFLVGESLMAQTDVTAATRALLAPLPAPA